MAFEYMLKNVNMPCFYKCKLLSQEVYLMVFRGIVEKKQHCCCTITPFWGNCCYRMLNYLSFVTVAVAFDIYRDW